MEWVVEYFKYADKNKHMNALEVPDMEIPPEMCLELLSAADYLESKLLTIYVFPALNISSPGAL